VTSFFQVLGMRCPIRVTGAPLSQNHLLLFVRNFQFLKNSTTFGRVLNPPCQHSLALEHTSQEGRDALLK
jgi:hypothetical protein